MYNIIKYGQAEATQDEINAHAEKLAFNTREEYFEWVKEWKEIYKNAVLHHRCQKLFERSHKNLCLPDKGWTLVPMTSEKALYKQNKQKQLESLITIESSAIVEKLAKEFKDDYNHVPTPQTYTYYIAFNPKAIVQYLLAVRRASKVRAAKKREERLKLEGKL